MSRRKEFLWAGKDTPKSEMWELCKCSGIIITYGSNSFIPPLHQPTNQAEQQKFSFVSSKKKKQQNNPKQF